MPEAVVSSEVNMGPTNVHMGPAPAEVSDADVTATKVASTKVTAAKVASAKVTAAVSATTVTASTASKGRGRDCRTSQKESGGEEQCFSQHQNLLHNGVSSASRYRRTFSVIVPMFRTMLDGKLRPVPCGNRARAPQAQLTSVLDPDLHADIVVRFRTDRRC
jgi:hypothetical protein